MGYTLVFLAIDFLIIANFHKTIYIKLGANGSESQDTNEGIFNWERRRPAGRALRNKIAAILHTCRRDAGAPSGRFP